MVTTAEGGWTQNDKISVLFSLIPDKPDWSRARVPQGRTLKAVQSMVGRMKKETEDSGAPIPTPKKTKGPARGKKAAMKSDDSEDVDDARASDAPPKKTPAKRKRAAVKSKETVEEDDDEDNEDELASEMESPSKKIKEENGMSEADTEGC